jgi:hypothetical protein
MIISLYNINRLDFLREVHRVLCGYELNIYVYYRLILILNPVYSMWGLCWTKWKWDRFVLWVVSYHQCSLLIFVLILFSFRRAGGWSLCWILGNIGQKSTFIQSFSLHSLNGVMDGVICRFVTLGDWLYRTSIMLDIVGAKLVCTVSVWRCVEWLYSPFEVTGFHYWRDSVIFILLWALWRPLEWGFRPIEYEALWLALHVRPPNYVALRRH